MSERIAFIGLGIMGTPMALNLVNAGHTLFVYARREDSMKPLLEAGAVPCASPASAAKQADFSITIVSDTPDVEEIMVGRDDGIIHGTAPDSTVIDMSTISPETTRQIASLFESKSVNFLDAPVSGGEQGAKDGSLSIMVGGPQKTFTRALPLLQVMGKNIVHVGSNGAGQVAKACNQLLVAQTMIAVAEAFELATASGVDPVRVREALLGGFAYSRILEVHGKRMLNKDYAPGFRAGLHLKDLRNTLAAAAAVGAKLPATALARSYLNELIEAEKGGLDSSAVAEIVHVHAKSP